MKLIKKFLGITAIIALIGLSFIACEGLNNDNGSTNGNNGGESDNYIDKDIDENSLETVKIAEETYLKFPLNKGYNTWAGQVYQKGWATGGIKFQGKDDAIVIAKSLGYNIKMFKRATMLMIEMPDASYPKSGFDIIWGGENENGSSTGFGMWNQQPIAGGSGDLDAEFAKKDGKLLIIDLTKALRNYYAYTKAAKLKIILQVNAPSYGNVEGLVRKAYLLIPKTPPPFVGVSDISLYNDTMNWKNKLELYAIITPSVATNQSVIWAIKSWESADGDISITLPNLDPSDPASVTAYETAKNALLEKVRWEEEDFELDDDTVYDPPFPVSAPTMIAPGEEASFGTVTVSATIKQAQQDNDGNFIDFTKEFTITIGNPPMFSYKINGVPYGTFQWGAVDNSGVTGGAMNIIYYTSIPVYGGGTGYTSYEIFYSHTGGGYGLSAHYVEITFPAGKELSDYKEVRCHYTSENCDLVGKSVRLKAMATKPPRTYNPGPYISTTSVNSNGKDTDLIFELFEDNAVNVDGATRDGIFGKGVGADLSSSATDPENAARFVAENEDGYNVMTAKKIYIWILPWADKGTRFTISDVEFISN